MQIRKAKPTETDPFITHGFLIADIVKGFYGRNARLERVDFNAKSSADAIGRFEGIANNWYQLALGAPNLQYVNPAGRTQFRVRFTLDADRDHIADYISFYSGDTTNKPLLTIQYYVP